MPDRHRLVIRHSGIPAATVVELDGKPLSFISRVELVVDARGHAEARLIVPGELVDLEADVEAFVLAHAASGDDRSGAHDGR